MNNKKKVDEDCECDEEIIPSKSKKSILDTSLYDKKYKSSMIQTQSGMTNEKPNVPFASNEKNLDFGNMEITKILVEYSVKGSNAINQIIPPKLEKEPPKMDLCNAFKLAGFQPDWTKEKVERMMQTEDGRALLQKVDVELKKLTGKKAISEAEIIGCFPNYLKKSKNVIVNFRID